MTDPRPRFSIVCAADDADPGLPDFMASLESQTFDPAKIEVVVVDVGSAGSRSAARNLGLGRAHGEWVTFPDPDGVLDPAYLAEVDQYLRKNPATVLAATRRMIAAAETAYPHNDRGDKLFTSHNRLRDLRLDTHHFHADAACAFFPLDELRRRQLSFDERIRPVFAGGHFCAAYLLRVAQPLVAFVATARYHDRATGTESSTPDPSWADPGRFTVVPEFGYLDLLLDGAARAGGRPPVWLQIMVVHELADYLRTSSLMYAQTTDDAEVLDHFHELMRRICALLDDDVIAAYGTSRLKPELREILRHGYRDETWHAPYALVDKLDTEQQAMRLSYRLTGPLPHEQFVVGGREVLPLHSKIRDVRFFDRSVVQERIVWLPYGTVRVVLDGCDIRTQLTEPGTPTHFLDSQSIRRRLDPDPDGASPTAEDDRRWSDGLITWLARTRTVRRYFGDAWVLMDRIINADDSAEHLFRYLRKHRRGVNAWFVVDRASADYRRLRADKYKRVVRHGSLAWKLLMLNARHLISTHVDHPIIRPEEIVRLARPGWRFTFLQHGVIKDDISRWLNGKGIDLFVTSTPQEHEWIAGDHTPYRYTTREARLTGLPRFDKVLAEGSKYPPDRRDLILVAPTWRQWLIVHEPTDNAARWVDAEKFRSSDYAAQWGTLLNSAGLRELAERTGTRIALLMHPGLQSALPLLELAPHIDKIRFDDQSVQSLFARARVVVTDYSSMAFNAAYIDRPLVYFQFDADRMFGGGHIGRRGYFDYERDGFGPVVRAADDAVAAVAKAVDNGPNPEPEYARRIASAFPQRDGRCCERTADAIAASTKRLRPQRGSVER